jgi:alpha-beta hydrolase superfamily lysophospholipase
MFRTRLVGSRRAVALLALLVLGAVPAPGLAAAEPTATGPVVDLPVSFTVDNVNRTLSPCASDGRRYTLRGHLTAPVAELRRPDRTVTLYLHGTNTGEWIWRLAGEHGSYVRTLATRGHASVTIDRLGYGTSPLPDGFTTCSGAQADMAHQVVQQLRTGAYHLEGQEAVTFGRVFAAGHSSGALLAETASYSFGDVDGVIVTAWAAVGLTPDTNRRFSDAYRRCLAGGEPEPGVGGTTGYVYFDPTTADFLAGGLGPAASRRTRAAVAARHSRNPCGVMVSEPMGIIYDLMRVDEIRVPVFIVFGGRDVLRQDVGRYPSMFSSSPDVSVETLPDSGHFLTLDVDADVLADRIAHWLDRHTGR